MSFSNQNTFIMKNLLMLFFAITSMTLSAQNVEWVSVEEAQQQATDSKKPILMDVYADWCKPCQKLSKSFEDEKVAAFVNANFIPVKFNAEHVESVEFNGKVYSNPKFDVNKKGRNAAHELTKELGTRGYPTLFVLENNTLEVADKFVGYKPADLLLKTLKETKAL